MSMVVDIHKKKGIRPEYDIYIGRKVRFVDWTYNSKWGNYDYGKDLKGYESYIRAVWCDDLDELVGKKLGCWCITTDKIEPLKCHGQILMKLLKEKYPEDYKNDK